MPDDRQGPCEFCTGTGDRVAGPEDGLREPAYACASCLKMLKNQRLALPLIRGHVTMRQRGSEDPRSVKDRVDRFMEMVSAWKLRS